MQNSFAHLSPNLTAHLTDRDSNTILSNHPSAIATGLSTIASAFKHAHESASRMGLGTPVRITVLTRKDIIVLQTAAIPKYETTTVSQTENGNVATINSGMLINTIVAPATEMAEARVASWTADDVAARLQQKMKR